MNKTVAPETYPDFDTRTLAIQKAVREAVWTHARLGRPVCGMEDGKVRWYTPEETLAMLEANPLPDNGDSASKTSA